MILIIKFESFLADKEAAIDFSMAGGDDDDIAANGLPRKPASTSVRR